MKLLVYIPPPARRPLQLPPPLQRHMAGRHVDFQSMSASRVLFPDNLGSDAEDEEDHIQLD